MEESFWKNDFLKKLFVLNDKYLVIGRNRKDRTFYDVFRFIDNEEIQYHTTIEGSQDSPLLAAKGNFIYGYRWPSLSDVNKLQNLIITKYSLKL
jgi:hypothetical protein